MKKRKKKRIKEMQSLKRQAIESRTRKIATNRRREKKSMKRRNRKSNQKQQQRRREYHNLHGRKCPHRCPKRREKTGFKLTLLSFLSNCFFYALSTYSKLFCNSWQLNNRKCLRPYHCACIAECPQTTKEFNK